jgi:hypothetical protein
LNVSAVALPVSPELALVCPEQAAEWRATLPDVDPDYLFRPAHLRPPVVAVLPQPAEREAPLAVAAAVYFVVNIVQLLAWGSVTFALVVAATLVATLLG